VVNSAVGPVKTLEMYPWEDLVVVLLQEVEAEMHMDLEHCAVIAPMRMDLMPVVAFLLAEGAGWTVVLKWLGLMPETVRTDLLVEAQKAVHCTAKDRVESLGEHPLQFDWFVVEHIG
jgi:hypothetical protein